MGHTFCTQILQAARAFRRELTVPLGLPSIDDATLTHHQNLLLLPTLYPVAEMIERKPAQSLNLESCGPPESQWRK